eukprot:15252-Prorocentrum_minimum.AAC.1
MRVSQLEGAAALKGWLEAEVVTRTEELEAVGEKISALSSELATNMADTRLAEEKMKAALEEQIHTVEV